MKLSFLQRFFKQTPTIPAPRSNNELTEVDLLFKQGLNQSQTTPPDNWKSIESRLSAHSWLDKHLWRLSLLIALLLLITAICYYCGHVKKPDEGPVAFEQVYIDQLLPAKETSTIQFHKNTGISV